MFYSIVSLLAPKWVQWACLALAVIAAVLAEIWQSSILWWFAGVLSGGAVSSKAVRTIKQGIEEAGPPPVRPPGHVEGDPLPPEFPPGTEAGPDHSPYDPKAP